MGFDPIPYACAGEDMVFAKTYLALFLILIATSLWAQEQDPWNIEIHPDYRMRDIYVDPYELSGLNVQEMHWLEQRLRLDMIMRYEGLGSVVLQIDALDGVLAGDNGRFGGNPGTNSGVSLTSRVPNLTRWKVGLAPGQDPLNPDSYVPVLEEVDPIQINFAYGEVLVPVGMLRIGRQPFIDGYALAVHDGGRYKKHEKRFFHGRHYNRWGVSQYTCAADRILFGTKLDEIIRQLLYGPTEPDMNPNRGVFIGGFYGWGQTNLPQHLDDDLIQSGFALQWKQDQAYWFDLEWRDIFASAILFNFSNDRFETSVWSLPMRFEGTVENFSWLLQAIVLFGKTKEISEGFAALSGKDPIRQSIKASGAQAVLDYRWKSMTFTLEFDYAEGDDDPRSDNDITTYNFSRDLNVGLLLFEHILAFESARSVAVGVENLSGLNASSFPLSEVQTDGRFTNAIAFFPQWKWDIVDTSKHHLHTRLGILMAWPQADGVVDPVMTVLAEDGQEIKDDAVNFHGGKPGDYYGTEFDFQLQWLYGGHFQWTLESAVLFPGNSLEDEHGQAVRSFLIENRFAYIF